MLSICISSGVCRGALKADFHNKVCQKLRIIAFLPLSKGKSEVGNEVACQEGSAEKLEELTVRESAQGDEINLIKVKVRALATVSTREKQRERERERERERKGRKKGRKKGIRRKLKTREDGELIVSQSLEERFAPNVERGWACEREQPFVCK